MMKDILKLEYQDRLPRAQPVDLQGGSSPVTLALAGAAGWLAGTSNLDEAALERRLHGGTGAETRVVPADFARVCRFTLTLSLLNLNVAPSSSGCDPNPGL